MSSGAIPRDDKEWMTHDPSAIPPDIMGPHNGGCGQTSEIRHDHPQLCPQDPIWWECSRSPGHMGRHAALYGGGIAASWARKV